MKKYFKKQREGFMYYLNAFKQRELSYKTILTIGETPSIYSKLGLESEIIRSSQKTLKHIEEKHPNAWIYMEYILDSIAEPVAVFGSLNEGQERSLIVITNKYINSRDKDEHKKELLIVILKPSDKIKNTNKSYSILVSVYGFNEFDIQKHLKGKQNERGNLKYIDEEKALKVADVSSLQGASSLMLRWNNFKSKYIVLTKEEIVKNNMMHSK